MISWREKFYVASLVLLAMACGDASSGAATDATDVVGLTDDTVAVAVDTITPSEADVATEPPDAGTPSEGDTVEPTADGTIFPEDTGPVDTGLEDTGLEDTGLEDTGLEDTGAEDTGLEDTGPEDTAAAPADLGALPDVTGLATDADTHDIIWLYVLVLHRPADPETVEYWANQLAFAVSGGTSRMDALNAIAASVTTEADFSGLYGGKSTTEQVVLAFSFILEHEPDAGAVAFYSDGLNSGQFNLPSVLLIFGTSPEAMVGSLNYRVDAAAAFSLELDTVDEVTNYNSTEGWDCGRAFLAGVTSLTYTAAIEPASLAASVLACTLN